MAVTATEASKPSDESGDPKAGSSNPEEVQDA